MASEGDNYIVIVFPFYRTSQCQITEKCPVYVFLFANGIRNWENILTNACPTYKELEKATETLCRQFIKFPFVYCYKGVFFYTSIIICIYTISTLTFMFNALAIASI